MSLLEIGPVIFGGTPAIITHLQSKHVIAAQRQCPCGTAMVLQTRRDISDGCRWRCSSCQKGVSIREGSFFEKSRLPLQKWLILIYWWARQYPVSDAQEEANVSNTSAIQVSKLTTLHKDLKLWTDITFVIKVYQWLREVCSYRLVNVDPPIKLGGQGVVVDIDESLYRHKPKVK